MLKNFFRFLFSKTFIKQILIYFFIVGLIIWGLLKWLDVFTNHNKYIKVPNFKGLPVSELIDFSKKNNVTYLIIDSVFELKTKPGIVLKQDPEVNAEVKEGRIVYLYISAISAPEIPMPKLIDRSLRQAISMIFSNGFKLGKINFIKDECTNCVIEQRINGKIIKPGTIVSKGNAINLTAGKGRREITVRMPCLYGLTKNDAIIRAAESSLAIDKIIYEGGKESPNAKVYKQIPECGDKDKEEIEIGGNIDIFLTTRENIIPEIPVDSLEQKKSNNDNDFDN